MARHGWQGSTGEYDEAFVCAQCSRRWRRPVQGARAPRYCSDACKQQAYRDRRRAQAAASSAGSGRTSGGSSGTRTGSAGGAGSSQSRSSGFGGGQQGSSSRSSGSAGGGQRSTSGAGASSNGRSEYHARHMSTGEARRTIFRIAGLADDGTISVKAAYRRASRLVHPDAGSTAEQAELFKLLSLAKSILDKAGLYV